MTQSGGVGAVVGGSDRISDVGRRRWERRCKHLKVTKRPNVGQSCRAKIWKLDLWVKPVHTWFKPSRFHFLCGQPEACYEL